MYSETLQLTCLLFRCWWLVCDGFEMDWGIGVDLVRASYEAIPPRADGVSASNQSGLKKRSFFCAGRASLKSDNLSPILGLLQYLTIANLPQKCQRRFCEVSPKAVVSLGSQSVPCDRNLLWDLFESKVAVLPSINLLETPHSVCILAARKPFLYPINSSILSP